MKRRFLLPTAETPTSMLALVEGHVTWSTLSRDYLVAALEDMIVAASGLLGPAAVTSIAKQVRVIALNAMSMDLQAPQKLLQRMSKNARKWETTARFKVRQESVSCTLNKMRTWLASANPGPNLTRNPPQDTRLVMESV